LKNDSEQCYSDLVAEKRVEAGLSRHRRLDNIEFQTTSSRRYHPYSGSFSNLQERSDEDFLLPAHTNFARQASLVMRGCQRFSVIGP